MDITYSNGPVELRAISEIDACIDGLEYHEKFGFLRKRMGLSNLLRSNSDTWNGLIGEYIMEEIMDLSAWDLNYEIEMIAKGQD